MVLFYPFTDMFLLNSSKPVTLPLKPLVSKVLNFLADKLRFDIQDLKLSGFEGALNLILYQ